jgi:hypothetical protein
MSIEIELYEPSPDPVRAKEGFVQHVGNRKISAIYNDLRKRLEKANLLHEIEYFEVMAGVDATAEFPKYRWIACYAVPGTSEGWYIHVDANKDDKRTLIFLGKVLGGSDDLKLSGYDYALKIAGECAKALNE